MKGRLQLLALMLAAALCWGESAPVRAAENNDALARQLQEIFRAHPELVLDVLRNNSEAVLDIAQQGANARRKSALERQWKQDAAVEKDMKLENRPMRGPANAKVRIVAFSDFTCHFCQQAAATVESILKEYGDGVSLVFKNLPLSEGVGVTAAQYFVALSLQDEDAAWTFYKKLFQNRDRLVSEGEDYIKSVVDDLKIDKRRLDKDRRSKRVAEILKEDQEDAQKLGIDGTPCFVVNNLMVRGALPLDLFKYAVDTARTMPLKK